MRKDGSGIQAAECVGIAYLAARLPDDHAIITSLPDHSELPALGVAGWRDWFIATVALACRAVSDQDSRGA